MLSDVDQRVGGLYEVRRRPEEGHSEWPKRRTYLIDPEGVIRRAYRVLDIRGHPAELLSDLASLQATGT